MEKENKIIPGKEITLPPASNNTIKVIQLGGVIQKMDSEQQCPILDALGETLAELLEENGTDEPELLEEEVIEARESIHRQEIRAVEEDEKAAENHLAGRRLDISPPSDGFGSLLRPTQLSVMMELSWLVRIHADDSQRPDPRFRQKGKGKTGRHSIPNHRRRIK